MKARLKKEQHSVDFTLTFTAETAEDTIIYRAFAYALDNQIGSILIEIPGQPTIGVSFGNDDIPDPIDGMVH